ncbi:MAG: PEGA domain-containing protein [Spirochaetales bacterium]|nr:PEGA domain-containing protein [Spirochaetales bacterium]
MIPLIQAIRGSFVISRMKIQGDKMVRRSILFFLLTFSLFQIYAENAFIETHPFGASVYFNGKLLEKQTPLRLTDLSPGNYTIKLVKKDFTIIDTELTVEAGKTAVLVLPLAPDFIIQRFTGEDRIVFNGTIQENKNQIFRIPEGCYDFSRKDGLINVKPVYENNWAINALYIGVPVFLLATAGLFVQDLVENSGDRRFSPTTMGMATLTVTSGGVLAGLLINRKRFNDHLPFAPSPPPANDEVALEYYRKGEDALTAGNFSEAQNWYLRLMEEQSGSRYYPHALYKMSKIHYLGGNDSLALAELRLLEEKYPTVELYDKTCKSMADVLYRTGKYAEALACLEKMEYLDPLYSRDEIKQYIEKIRELVE